MCRLNCPTKTAHSNSWVRFELDLTGWPDKPSLQDGATDFMLLKWMPGWTLENLTGSAYKLLAACLVSTCQPKA